MVSLASLPARANGRFPAANSIIFSPSDPNLVIVRATYGLLPSFDGGSTWRFLCEDALGVAPGSDYDPAIALTAANHLIIGLLLPGGLEVSPDTGCNWNCVGGALANETIADLAVRPDAPHSVVALTGTVFFDDAGGGEHAQAFQSVDDGANWLPLGLPIDPTVLVSAIEVAATDPHRLFVSALRGFGPTRSGVLFVSVDEGATWVEHDVALDADEGALFIGAVDPLDADRVYLRTSGHSRLLLTTDAGRSFSTVLTLSGSMLGFALSPDGSRIYAGSIEDGLFVADRANVAFAPKSAIHVQCLATQGAVLWACSDEASGFVAGVSTDDGATFTPRLHQNGVQAPVDCVAGSQASYACGVDANASQCAGAPFDQLCSTIGCRSQPIADAMPRAGAEAEPRAEPSCKCGLNANGSTPRGLAAVAALVVATAYRRCQRPGRNPQRPPHRAQWARSQAKPGRSHAQRPSTQTWPTPGE
jgi:hypothetical protein